MSRLFHCGLGYTSGSAGHLLASDSHHWALPLGDSFHKGRGYFTFHLREGDTALGIWPQAHATSGTSDFTDVAIDLAAECRDEDLDGRGIRSDGLQPRFKPGALLFHSMAGT